MSIDGSQPQNKGESPNLGKRWVKGQSGNPGGRPRLEIHVREMARSYTEQAIRTLAKHLDNRDGNIATRAAVALLNRGWGAPEQKMTIDGAEVCKLTTEEQSLLWAKNYRTIQPITERLVAAIEANAE